MMMIAFMLVNSQQHLTGHYREQNTELDGLLPNPAFSVLYTILLLKCTVDVEYWKHFSEQA